MTMVDTEKLTKSVMLGYAVPAALNCGPGGTGCTGKASPRIDAQQALEALLQEPYFKQRPPKSTGRDLFHLGWLNPFLRAEYAPQDIQATLLKLTVKTIFQAIDHYCKGTQEVFVCGGGARNGALMNSLRHACAGNAIPVALTDALGVPAEQVEALAFAWLARQTLRGEAGNLPSVTGARHPCILGAIYPAGRID